MSVIKLEPRMGLIATTFSRWSLRFFRHRWTAAFRGCVLGSMVSCGGGGGEPGPAVDAAGADRADVPPSNGSPGDVSTPVDPPSDDSRAGAGQIDAPVSPDAPPSADGWLGAGGGTFEVVVY